MIDFELDENFQSSYTLKMRLPADDPRAATLEEDELLEYNGEQFYISQLVSERTAEKAYVSIEAEIAWMRLADIKRPGTFTIDAETPEAGVNMILYGTDWVGSQFTDDATLYTMELTDASVLDLLWEWAKITGNEIQFSTIGAQTIQFIPSIGADRGISFRYGRNMNQIKRTVIPPKATRLYAYGKRDDTTIVTLAGGKEYIEDYSFYTAKGLTIDEARARYRKDEIFQDDSFVDSASLYQEAVRRLAILSQPEIKYEASVLDLSELTNYTENDFYSGDTVWVYDGLLNINVQARVTRRQRFPMEPWRNKIELTFGSLIMPDARSRSSRSDATRSWELFESNNRTTERIVGAGTTILNRLALVTTTGTEWVFGYSFHGVGVGTGTLILEATNDSTGQDMWPPVSFDFVDGQEINWHFSYAEDEVPAADSICVIRAYTTGGGTVDVPMRGTQFWVLARGTTQRSPTIGDSIRFDFNGNTNHQNGSIQKFTVPDDVTEIQIEAHGGGGHPKLSSPGGLGGMVTARFSVLGGQIYDVYVGGGGSPQSNHVLGGFWPNGGSGGDYNSSGGNGGGASFVTPEGAGLPGAIIVAGGGGGAGAWSGAGPYQQGGHAGFYAGLAGSDSNFGQGGGGATQDAPGAGGNNLFFGVPTGSVGEAGDVDGQGQGGDSLTNPGIGTLGVGSGGGGGGWHGGGGGGNQQGSGGGGSGWMTGGWDLEFTDQDPDHDTDGYIIISWEAPEDVT